MKIEEIKTIVKLMAENDLTEFKVESEDMHLCIRRDIPVASTTQVIAAPAPVMAAPVQPAASAANATAPATPAAVPASASQGSVPADKSKVIESPIVGTFFRCATPGGEPFVKPGMKIDADTTVCIVEAMKVMNEIKAEKAGVIKEVLVENGEAVEFGQPLFILE